MILTILDTKKIINNLIGLSYVFDIKFLNGRNNGIILKIIIQVPLTFLNSEYFEYLFFKKKLFYDEKITTKIF